jgi:hypothetical protein
MSDKQLIVVGLLIALGLGVFWLWLKDYLYRKSTGRPASDRVRERNEQLNRPLSRNQYLGRSVLLIAIIAFLVSESVWADYYKGWARGIPLAWALSAGFAFYKIQIKWRNQQRSESLEASAAQLSGTPR